jgi:chemotaxis protein CheC
MVLNDYSDLNEIQIDVLKEIGNIGAGNAATSLAIMLDRPISISVPTIRILDYNETALALGGPENMIVGILLSFSGDISGMLMFLLQLDFAHMTLNALLGQKFTSFNDIGDMGNSALKELANIMTSSYINAISKMTNLRISISVPDMAIDMAGAILSVPAIHYANISDKIILIEDQFFSDHEAATSQILMIPDIDSLAKIMTSLGIAL